MTYFGRVYKLEVELNNGDIKTYGGIPKPGDDYRPLQIQFMIDQSPNAMRAKAEITLYGLNRESRKAVYEQGRKMTLTAGWPEKHGVIFIGSLENVELGRSGPDTFIKIFGNSVTESWREATISQTFGRNTPQKDIIRAVAETFSLPVDFVGDFDSLTPALLGKTVDKESSIAVMNGMARSFDFTWQINNGRTVIVKGGASNEGEPIAYKPTNGIIGTPEITDKGVNIDVLLNPFVRPYDTYTVESETGAISVSGVYYKRRDFPKTNGESINRVVSMVHEGDFYGDIWQTKLEGMRPGGN